MCKRVLTLLDAGAEPDVPTHFGRLSACGISP